MNATTPANLRPDLYVLPGRLAAAREARQLRTVLGSCVSVCLFDPLAHIGGMNHFLLPEETGAARGSLRFAGPAIRRLIEELAALGASRSRLVAKVFGGSVASAAGHSLPVGYQNVRAAHRLLREERIRVVAQDVGGPWGRKVLFRTGDGVAFVKSLGGGEP